MRIPGDFSKTKFRIFCEMKLQRVGDYLLGEKLGEGSFAKVRVGLHVISREKVSEIFQKLVKSLSFAIGLVPK